MLVVDITKGVQTQTAECLVIGDITCDHMIVVLNKVDLVPQEKREAQVEKVFILLKNKRKKYEAADTKGKLGRYTYLGQHLLTCKQYIIHIQVKWSDYQHLLCKFESKVLSESIKIKYEAEK